MAQYTFIDTGESIYRVLAETVNGAYIISHDEPTQILFVSKESLRNAQRIQTPSVFEKNIKRVRKPTKAVAERMEKIAPLLEDDIYIFSKEKRDALASELAKKHNTKKQTILAMYYKYLGTGAPSRGQPVTSNAAPKSKYAKEFDYAIREYYFSAKRHTLKQAYMLMLSELFTEPNGSLKDECPTFRQFYRFYRNHGYNTLPERQIAREGLTSYQRNNRPILGNQRLWAERIGASFQVDATMADIFLRDEMTGKVLDRPTLYLAVDTLSGLITGIHITIDDLGENAVMALFWNIVRDKVEFCREYGIDITPDQWPCSGALPKTMVVDRGQEFNSSRLEELCIKYGLTIQRLKPFRPDNKGMVEKTFDLLQSSYKSLLRGKGVVEPDAAERWAIQYSEQATLSLREYTAIVLNCVIYLNSARVLPELPLTYSDATPTAAGLWKWCEQMQYSDMLPVDMEEIRVRLLPRETGYITRSGLKYNNIRYFNSQYKQRFYLAGLKGNEKVTVAYDEDNVDSVYLYEDDQFVKFDLAPSNLDVSGMSWDAVDSAHKEANSKRKALKKTEEAAQIELQETIKKIVSGEMK